MTDFMPWSRNPKYLIYSDGKVYSKCINQFLTQIIKGGYYTVTLTIDKKSTCFRVHRLVAEMFCPNPDDKPVVDHIDRNPLNNNYTNLRWATHQDNAINREKTKASFIPIRQYRPDGIIVEYESITQAAEFLNMPRQVISRCVRGEWKHATCRDGKKHKFEYITDRERIEIPDNSKEIPGYPGYYITDDGQVFSDKYQKFMQLQLTKAGYHVISLCNNAIRKKFFVHRLVCESFSTDKPPNYQELAVNHKDGNRTNNNISNLEYVTIAENNKHAREVLKKCTEKNQPKQPVHMYDPENLDTPLETFVSIKAAADHIGRHYTSIVHAMQRESKCAGFIFKKVITPLHENEYITPKRQSKTKKPVRMYSVSDPETLIKEFSSVKLAGDYIKYDPSSIFHAMKDNRSIGGYIFKRIPDEEIPDYLKSFVPVK